MVQQLYLGDYKLVSGVVLPVTAAYVMFGQLNAAGDNAILVTHGYTSGPSMLTREHHTAEGTWASLVGHDEVLDSDKYCIICSNMLGSAFGTTGPNAINTTDGKPWGGRFPAIRLEDIVGVQRALLDKLGVTHLKAVLGPSYGGWQALQWAVQYPDFVSAAGAVVSGLTHPEGLSAQSQKDRFAACPDWHGGDYYAHGGMIETLKALRWKTMQDYGLETLYADRYADPEIRQTKMQEACDNWAHKFDAHSMIVLAGAAEHFDVRHRLQDIRCKLWFAVCTTDKIFPPNPQTTQLLEPLAVPVRYQEIDSPYGHMASGVEWQQLQEPIRWLLSSN